MIGHSPIGVTPISATLALEITSEDVQIRVRVSDTYPADFQAAASNFEVDTFKDITSAGSCLEFYNGRLYYAIDNFIYCTKAFDVEHVDLRFTVVAGFADNVTMIAGVDGGLFVGTATNVYFLKGDSPLPEDGGFTQSLVSPVGAVYGTMSRCNGEWVPAAGSSNEVVLWMSRLGVFVGSDGGACKCLTLNTVSASVGATGCSTVLKRNGFYQYITCYDVDATQSQNISDAATAETQGALAVNLTTGTSGRFINYGFTSFFERSGAVYGCNASGVWELTGDTDFITGATDAYGNLLKGVEINASVTTPSVDFDKQQLKFVPDAYLDARTPDTIELDVLVNEEISCEGLQAKFNNTEGLQRRRFKLPRGLKGTTWRFTLRNIGGAYFKLFNFEVAAVTSQRIV